MPDGDALLVTFYQNAGYTGAYVNVYGKDGPCDSSGYGLSDLAPVNDDVAGISSYIYGNECVSQEYWDAVEYQGASNNNYSDCPFVGSTWNDTLLSMKLWRQYN